MYDKIFAISQVSNNQNKHDFQLKNYSYLGGELEEDFYYRSFLKTLLFKIDILALEDFLDYQFENSKDDIKFLKVLERKVISDIKIINKNSGISGIPVVYRGQEPLQDGFVLTQGIIKNASYDFSSFYHITASQKLNEDLITRIELIAQWLITKNNSDRIDNSNKLTWVGKPSHLAFFIRRLIDEGYIDAPIRNSGDINLSALSRQISNTFDIKNGGAFDTLIKYLNPDSDKSQELSNNLSKQDFHIPTSGTLG